jgi:ATP:corrinoid adenosyltransferase
MTKKRLARGLIRIYTGDGKGKTTCPLSVIIACLSPKKM